MNQLLQTFRGTEEVKHLALLELCRRDVNTFLSYVFLDKDGQPWEQQEFHKTWQAMLPTKGPARVLIVAPRDHAKSTQLSIGRVLWELGNNPNLRIKLITSGDNLATDLLGEIKEQIETNPKIQEIFPHLLPDKKRGWDQTAIFINRTIIAKDPSIEACGILSTGAGGRADLLVFDDVVDFRNAISQSALRESVKKAFYEVWLNLLEPDGRALYVGTVYHTLDLTCDLKAHDSWDTWWKPAMEKETGTVLWPSKWSLESLQAKEKEIGTRAFSRQFMLKPLSDDEVLFTPTILEACYSPLYPFGAYVAPKEWSTFIGVDLASSLGKKAAYTVAFVAALNPEDKKLYPVDLVRSKLQFPETVEAIKRLYEEYSPLKVMVENNGYQEVLLQHLKATHPNIPVESFTTGKNKMDEKLGLPGMAAWMANGGLIIPRADPHPLDCDCPWCWWLTELQNYPASVNSDTIMAQFFCWRASLGSQKRVGYVLV